MPYSVRCKACSAVFAIPDDIWDRRVRGRMATLKCRACKGDIQVDGSKADAGKLSEAPESLPSTPAASEPVASAPKPAVATSKASPALSPEATSPAAAPPHAEPVSVTAAAPVSTVKTDIKPKAVAPSQIAAAETGWSLMPPPAELETLQIPVIPPATLTTPKVVSPTVAEEKPAPAPLIQEKSAQEEKPAPVAPAPVTVVEPAPAEVPSELWVVSYGDDDDRELTEKQIAAELSRGKINATTIVWREEMPEWLPISGVKELAKYLPNQKPRIAAGKSQATTKTAGTKPATVTPAQKQDAKVTAQPKTATSKTTVTAVKQPATSSPTQKRTGLRESQGDIPPVLAGGTHGGKSVTAKQPDLPPVLAGGLHPEKQSQAKPAPAAAKGPPPLARAAQKSSESLGGATEPAAHAAHSTGNKPPALPSRGSKVELTEATVPWRKAQESTEEEVLTSAPHIDQVSSPDVPVPAPLVLEPTPPETPRPTTNERPTAQLTPAAFPTTDASPRAIAPEPQSHPSAKVSFRPPKPVETATSLVVHTKNAAQAGVHEITDDDFLAMQRRVPKWALPAGIGGGVIVLGLIVYAATSGDEPPPLPVAPVAVPLNTLSVDGASRPSQQPDLSNLPTTGGVSSATNTNGDFASAFAKAAGKSTGNFDAKAAERAASAAIERAAKCRVGSDPTGLLKATVTIAPSGQVTGVQVSPPYTTLATGKCVDKALRGFTVKPFQGEAASLPLSFNLR